MFIFRITLDEEEAILEVLDPTIPKWFKLGRKHKIPDIHDRSKPNVFDRFSDFSRNASYRDDKGREVVIAFGDMCYNYKIIKEIKNKLKL